MSAVVIALVLLAVTVALGCYVEYQLLLQNGRLMQRLEALEQRLEDSSIAPDPATDEPMGLPVGSVALDFELPDLLGGSITLSQWRGQRVLLIFFDPRCGFCLRMLPDLAALPDDPGTGGVEVPVRPQLHPGAIRGEAIGRIRQRGQPQGPRRPVRLAGDDVDAAFMSLLLRERGIHAFRAGARVPASCRAGRAANVVGGGGGVVAEDGHVFVAHSEAEAKEAEAKEKKAKAEADERKAKEASRD